MKTGQHVAEQIIRILDQAEKGEQTVAAICRAHGIAETCSGYISHPPPF